VRVKAADGTMQPPRTKAEQLARAELHRKWDHVARLRSALAQLAQNEDSPASIVECIVSVDRAEIGANLEKSLAWLMRFAEHWHCHGTKERPQVAHRDSRRVFRLANIRAANDP
jgi:anti-sigma factor ChrR (cupin superfamily)